MRTWIVQCLAPILCGLTLLLGVIGVGRAARACLRDRETYRLAFSDIDCQPPEGMSRAAFLREVRTVSHQPGTLHLLDEDLTARLHRAFLAHPWVDSVRRVDIGKPSSGSQPLKTPVQVEIVYRRAVLAVALSADKIPPDGSALIAAPSGTNLPTLIAARAVDRYGVLLPVAAVQAHLPVFMGDVRAPGGAAGSHWGDAHVVAAARTAAFLQAHLNRLRLDGSAMEFVEGEIVFLRPGVRIVWGHAPGQEKEGEAPAKVKLRRLLDYQNGHDGLESLEHDVRLIAYQGHFPLSSSAPPDALASK